MDYKAKGEDEEPKEKWSFLLFKAWNNVFHEWGEISLFLTMQNVCGGIYLESVKVLETCWKWEGS